MPKVRFDSHLSQEFWVQQNILYQLIAYLPVDPGLNRCVKYLIHSIAHLVYCIRWKGAGGGVGERSTPKGCRVQARAGRKTQRY